MSRLIYESGCDEIAKSHLLRAARAPVELRPPAEGMFACWLSLGRIPERGGEVLLKMARRHAANPRFYTLCQEFVKKI